jgi:nitrous oxidase accessory protein NosD
LRWKKLLGIVLALLLLGVLTKASSFQLIRAEPDIQFKSTYLSHSPISIYNDALFTPENGVTSGNGTEENPYIIESWSIDANVATGIWVTNTSSYFVIRNCKIYGSNIGVFLYTINGRIENCELSGESHSTVSILLAGSSNTIVWNNSLSNGGGIHLVNSCNNVQIRHNHLVNCTGILLYGGHYANVVSDNLIEGPYQYSNPSEACGMIEFSANSDLNTAMNNTILSGYGFRIDSSSGNTLKANTMENAHIWIDGSLLRHFRQDIDSSNTVNGKPVYYFWNQTLNFDASSAGSIIVANSTGKIDNLRGGNGSEAIIAFSHEISFANSSFSRGGIYAKYCDKITIQKVHMENSSGVILFYVSNSSTIDCELFDSMVFSVGGLNNTFRNDTINGFGIVLYGESYSRVESNTIIGKKLTPSPPNSIARSEGTYLFASSHNTIAFNSISNFTSGIGLNQSSLNMFYENTLFDNGAQINCTNSAGNLFYHNSFLGNTNQVDRYNSINVWDNGYPSGGNYWSDHSGVDLFTGPYQNISGSDGIYDTPYTINPDNKDNYPLTNPWSTLIGDIDGDGDVDHDDLDTLSQAYGTRLGGSNYYTRADLDQNGIVALLDLYTLGKNYGKP